MFSAAFLFVPLPSYSFLDDLSPVFGLAVQCTRDNRVEVFIAAFFSQWASTPLTVQ